MTKETLEALKAEREELQRECAEQRARYRVLSEVAEREGQASRELGTRLHVLTETISEFQCRVDPREVAPAEVVNMCAEPRRP